jgi:cystathionine beta-lyase/cystathionine gamma-synthase
VQVIYTEAVSNPTLVLADLPAIAEIAHSRVGPCAYYIEH